MFSLLPVQTIDIIILLQVIDLYGRKGERKSILVHKILVSASIRENSVPNCHNQFIKGIIWDKYLVYG